MVVVNIFMPTAVVDIDDARKLMKEYESSLNLDLGYQDFGRELNELPGKYGPPSGYLLLAHVDGEPAGCVAIRKIDAHICEMKRLFVLPAYRGKGVGRQLVQTIIQKAKDLGYASIKLDSVEWMREAVSLYRSLGFVDTDAYTFNPSDDAVYLELLLVS